MSQRDKQAPFDCPNCGERVPGGALACPACGSDEETGWSDQTMYDDLDLPPDEDDSPMAGQGGFAFWQWIAAAVLVLLFLLVLSGTW